MTKISIRKNLLRSGSSGGKAAKRSQSELQPNKNEVGAAKTNESKKNKNDGNVHNNIKLNATRLSKSTTSISSGGTSDSTLSSKSFGNKNNCDQLVPKEKQPSPKSSTLSQSRPPPQQKLMPNQPPRLAPRPSDLFYLTQSLPLMQSQQILDDDEQTIHRLEHECQRLSLTLQKVKKYSHEWFFLDAKLSAAKEELDAAYEDRNIVLDFGLDGGNVNTTANEDKKGSSSGGGGVPESVHAVHNQPSSATNATTEMVDGDLVSDSANNDTRQSLQAIHSDNADDPGSNTQQTKNQQLPDTDGAKKESERIVQQLKSVPKFSPEWFQLKEDYIDVRTALESEGGANVTGIRDVAAQPDQLDSATGIKQAAPLETNRSTEHENDANIDNADGESNKETIENIANELGNLDEQELQELNIEFAYNVSPIEVPPYALSPSLSPSTTDSKSSSKHQRSLSPPLSPPSSPILGKQLFPPFTPPEVITARSRSNIAGNYYYHHGEVEEENNFDNDLPPMPQLQHSQKESESQQERMNELKADHAAACVKLSKLEKFSEPWFAAKTQMVLLEEQMDEAENASSSGRSVSGWSHFSSVSGGGGVDRSLSSGWSDHEDESMSLENFDLLERVMVVEALKQGNCISPIADDGGDGADNINVSSCPGSIMTKELGKVDSSVGMSGFVDKPAAATAIQSVWRKHLYRSKFCAKILSSIAIQSWFRMSLERIQFGRMLSSVAVIQIAIRKFLTEKKCHSSSPEQIPNEVFSTPSKALAIDSKPPVSPRFASNSLLSPSGERTRLKVKEQQYKWLSVKLVHVTKYSDEWFETKAQLREMKEEIEMLDAIYDDAEQSQRSKEDSSGTSQQNNETDDEADVSLHKMNGRVMKIVETIEQSQTSKSERNRTPTSDVEVSRSDEFEAQDDRFHTPTKPQVLISQSEETSLKKVGKKCIQLSREISSLTKFSSEWFQSKVELELATKELEALYAEAMKKERKM